MFTSYDKAIAAFLTAVVSLVALFGLPVPDFLKDPSVMASVTAVLTGLVTYLVPNKAKA